MYYLIAFVGLVSLLVIVFGVVGYKKSKKEYAAFLAQTLSKLPAKKADIFEIKTDKKKYAVSFEDHGTAATKTFLAEEINILYDLKKDAKPYITYKSLNKDVPFPKVKTWEVKQGLYNVEIHVTEDYMNSI
jgi:hypothetical protein